MKIAKNGDIYRLYEGNLIVLEQLPAKTYIVKFNRNQGFYLEETAELEVREQKVYGVHEEKIEKVISRFRVFERNLGVILSGDKGIGKSLFARMLSQAVLKAGYPVIVVDEFTPGIHSFIESIEQEVMILFDEFDKKFTNKDDGAQASLLSMLDGMTNGKKLFVITCNNYNRLNEYMINRPGRFHFHFRFNCPSISEVKIYLQDKLDEQYWCEIPKVISFSVKVPLNYDCLRAIAFELQQGEPFETAIEDLNILNTEHFNYNFYLRFHDGTVLQEHDQPMDLFSTDTKTLWLYDANGNNEVGVEFTPSMANYDIHSGGSIISEDNLHIVYDDKTQNTAKLEYINRIKNLQPLQLEIVRNQPKGIHYEV